MPERHDCCIAARRHLVPRIGNGSWYWVLRPRSSEKVSFELRVLYCPWCGESLPDRGRLVVREVRDGG